MCSNKKTLYYLRKLVFLLFYVKLKKKSQNSNKKCVLFVKNYCV